MPRAVLRGTAPPTGRYCRPAARSAAALRRRAARPRPPRRSWRAAPPPARRRDTGRAPRPDRAPCRGVGDEALRPDHVLMRPSVLVERRRGRAIASSVLFASNSRRVPQPARRLARRGGAAQPVVDRHGRARARGSASPRCAVNSGPVERAQRANRLAAASARSPASRATARLGGAGRRRGPKASSASPGATRRAPRAAAAAPARNGSPACRASAARSPRAGARDRPERRLERLERDAARAQQRGARRSDRARSIRRRRGTGRRRGSRRSGRRARLATWSARGRADAAGAVGAGRRDRPSGGAHKRLRQRMRRHAHRQRVEPGAGQQRHGAVRPRAAAPGSAAPARSAAARRCARASKTRERLGRRPRRHDGRSAG